MAPCQDAGVVVIIRIHCQLNTPASLQTPAHPSLRHISAQPLVRTNKILLTNFYFFHSFSSDWLDVHIKVHIFT